MTVGSPFNIFAILGTLITVAALLIWVERRLLAVWQDRLGPNRVGPLGLFQVVADMLKILTKEDWVPPFADKPVFILAPTVIMVTALTAFGVVPIAPGVGVIDLSFGLLYFLALASLSVYSVILAGYASNSKYALYGALRAAAQTLSYSQAKLRADELEGKLPAREMQRLVKAQGDFAGPAFAQCISRIGSQPSNFTVVVALGMDGRVKKSWLRGGSSFARCFRDRMVNEFFFRPSSLPFFTSFEYTNAP